MKAKQWGLMLLAAALLLTAACAPAAGVPAADAGAGAAQDAISGKVEGEITVSSYDSMMSKSFLDAAAKAFEAKYPGTKVNVETFSAMPEVKTMEQDGKKVSMMQMGDDTQARADYINKISTELMGGKGADVLAMDILPYYKYAENGQLEDLSAYMQADEELKLSDYRENVFKAAQYNGKQVFLPLDYEFNYFAYDSSLLDEQEQAALGDGAFTYEKLAEIGAAAFERSQSSAVPAKMFNYSEYSPRGMSMVSELLKENYAQFVDIASKRANFTDGSFEAMLARIKEMGEKGYLAAAMNVIGDPSEIDMGSMLERNKDERYFFKPQSSVMLLQNYNKGGGNRMMISFGTSGGNDEDDEVAGIQTDAAGNVPFTFTQGYGINANSANKATAWAFIKFLLSEEMQSSPQLSMASLPVHNAARMLRAKMMLSGEMLMGPDAEASAPAEIQLDEQQQAVYEQYTSAVEKFSDQINSLAVTDETIDAIIGGELKHYFDGAKTAAEVAETLQSKISTYLNE